MTNEELPARLTSPDQAIARYDRVGADPDEEGSGVDFGRLYAALLRFRWLMVIGAILGAGGAVIGWTRTDRV